MSGNFSVSFEELKEKIYSYLDSQDSKSGDGYIDKSVWTKFVKLDGVEGRDINYRIRKDKAKNSIGYYLTKGDKAVQSILDYCGLKVEHTEEEAQEELTDDPTPTEATGKINDNPTSNEATGDVVITDETTIADSEEVAPNGEENSTDTDEITTDKGQDTQIAAPPTDENAQGKASTSSNTQNQTAENKDETPAVIQVKKEEKKDIKEEKPVSAQKKPEEPQQKTPTNPAATTGVSPWYRPSITAVVGSSLLSIQRTKTYASVKNQTVTKEKVRKMLDIIYNDYGIQGEKLNYIEQWTNIIYENATKYNVEPEAIIAIIANECLFNINVKTGCLGIMQVSSGTAKSILNNSNNYYSNLDENLYNDVVYESGKKITFSRMKEKIKTDKNYAMKVGILVYKSKAKKAGNNQEKTFYHYNGNVNAANKDTISRRRNCGRRTAFANYPKVAAYNEKLRNLSYGTAMRLGYSYEAMRVYEILKASV